MKYLLFLIILLFSTVAFASDEQMEPLPNEKLQNPITLTQECKNVRIVEWKESDSAESKMTKAHIETLDKLCRYAILKFPEFLKSRGLKMNHQSDFQTSISLLPIDTEFRNLNDLQFRFSTRSVTYDENGDPYQIYGYFQRKTNHIYVRNDVAEDAKVVFLHELFHAASLYYGVYYQYPIKRASTDENMAKEFTKFIGFGV